MSCSSSDKLMNERVNEFWEMSTFHPKIILDICGTYNFNHGLGGGILELNKDSSFNIREWADLIDLSNPFIGSSGKYQIRVDTLLLEINSVNIDTSIFKKLHPDIKDERIINRLIKDTLKYENEKYDKFLASLKDTNITRYNRIKDWNKYYIKRIGDYIFLVRLPFKDMFMGDLRNYIFPELCENCKNKIFAFYYTRINKNL